MEVAQEEDAQKEAQTQIHESPGSLKGCPWILLIFVAFGHVFSFFKYLFI